MVCHCGFTNKQGARYCGSCGKPLAGSYGTDVGSESIQQPSTARAARFSKGTLSLLLVGAVIAGLGYWWSTRPPGRYVADNSDLFPISEANKHGFMNKSGQTVIPPQFDEVKGFSEGMSAVRVGNKWGYISTRGEITITPQFDDAQSFYYGHAAVKLCCGPWFSNNRNDRYGFIDTDGKYIHTPDFLWVGLGGFERQLAAVKTSQGQMAFLNRQGQLLFAGQFDSITNDGFTEGLAGVRSGGKWGFIDEKGDWVINPQFETVQGFSEGLAAVTVGGKTGFIDRSGRFAINPQFASASMFIEGHAIFGNERGELGLINREGQVTVEAGRYQSVDVLRSGLMRVKGAEGWGFVDGTGTIVIPLEFDSAGVFQNGLARVTALGKEGYINTSGDFVLNPFPGSSLKAERERIANEAKAAAEEAERNRQAAEAARIAAEAKAVEERNLAIAEFPQRIVGTWRWEGGSTTEYRSDGAIQGVTGSLRFVNNWRIDGETLIVRTVSRGGRNVPRPTEQSWVIDSIDDGAIRLRTGNGRFIVGNRVQ